MHEQNGENNHRHNSMNGAKPREFQPYIRNLRQLKMQRVGESLAQERIH